MTAAPLDLFATSFDDSTVAESAHPGVKYAVEAIGTFCLLTTVGMALCAANPVAALAIGAVLLAMMYAGGQLAGGHFNPAITLAAVLRGRIGLPDAVGCWCAQLSAGFAAAIVWCVVVDPDQLATAASMMLSGRILAAAAVAEFLFAFALSYVVLGGAGRDTRSPNMVSDLAVGVGVIAGTAVLAAVADGVFDPAVALGSTVVGLFSWPTLVVFLISQVIAGAFAGIAFLLFGSAAR